MSGGGALCLTAVTVNVPEEEDVKCEGRVWGGLSGQVKHSTPLSPRQMAATGEIQARRLTGGVLLERQQPLSLWMAINARQLADNF